MIMKKILIFGIILLLVSFGSVSTVNSIKIEKETLESKLYTLDSPIVWYELDPPEPNGKYGGVYVSPVTVSLFAANVDYMEGIYYSFHDEERLIKYDGPFQVYDDGKHTIHFYAYDILGIPKASGVFSFRIDRTPPSVSINSPILGSLYFNGKELFQLRNGRTILIGGFNFEATASGAYVVYFKIEGDDYLYGDTKSPYELEWSNFDESPKEYQLEVIAYDYAGHIGTDTISFTHWR
jgi:hypothetical protein